MLQLIAVLGKKDASRKAILKALAGKQGFSSEYDIEPAYMRRTLADIGLSTALSPLSILEVAAGEESLLMVGDSWRDL